MELLSLSLSLSVSELYEVNLEGGPLHWDSLDMSRKALKTEHLSIGAASREPGGISRGA